MYFINVVKILIGFLWRGVVQIVRGAGGHAALLAASLINKQIAHYPTHAGA